MASIMENETKLSAEEQAELDGLNSTGLTIAEQAELDALNGVKKKEATTPNSTTPVSQGSEPSTQSVEIEVLDLPQSYQSDRANYKDLVGGKKYNLLRGGKPITGTWDATTQTFIKDPLLNATPQRKKEVGFLQAVEAGVNLEAPVETQEEMFGRLGVEVDDLKKEAKQKNSNIDYITSYPSIQRLGELEKIKNSTDDAKVIADADKKIAELRSKKMSDKEFEGIRFDSAEGKVYQNFLPAKQVEEFKGEVKKLPKTDLTVGEAYDEVKDDSDYIQQVQGEIKGYGDMVNQYMIDKLPDEVKQRLEPLKGTNEYDAQLETELVKSQEIENIIPALAYGLDKKLDALMEVGSNIGLDDDRLVQKKLGDIREKQMFGKNMASTRAEIASSIGGMLPDIVAGGVYSPLMMASMISTMPNDFLEQCIAEQQANGEPIDVNKCKEYALASTAAQTAMLFGAGKVGSHGLNLLGKTTLKRAGELIYEMAKRGTKDAIIFGGLGTVMQNKINKAYDLAENDEYLKQGLHMAIIGGMFALKEGIGKVKGVSKKTQNEVDYLASYLPEEYTRKQVEQLAEMGKISPADGEESLDRLNTIRAIRNQIPADLSIEQMDKIYPLWVERRDIQAMLNGASSEFKSVLSGQIEDIDRKILIKAAVPLTSAEKLEMNILQKGEAENKTIDKARLRYLEERRDAAKEVKEEKKVAEAETPTNVGVEEGSVGVGGDVGRKPIGDGKFVRYNPDDVLPLLPDYKPTNTGAVEDYVNQVVPNDASVEAYKTVPLDAIQTSEKIESKDRKAIDKIKEGIKNGDDIPPLVLDFSPVIKNGESYKFGLMDGHHRYIAYKELGIKEVPAAIVTSREHYTFETNDTNVKTLFGQSLKETTKAEKETVAETVTEKGVEEPITEEIKTAIDNGEITREQVDDYIKNNDGAKSESTIEAIERKAESEDEKQRNEAIDQADKLIGEAVGATEGEKQPTDKGTSEDKVTGIKKAMVEKDRADAGLPPIELPKSNKPQEQLERAKELVDSGEVDPSELEAYLISHAENPSDAKTSEADQYILQYQRMKIEARSKEILTERMAIEDRLKEDPTDVQANLDLASNENARQQNIYDLDRNTIASRVTSSIWGKLGNAKQQVINERGIVQEQINRIKDLHGKDVPKEVQDKLDSLEKKNTELTARIEAIEKNITEQIAQGQLNKESRKPLIRRTSRRSDEEINAQIKDKLSTIANKIAERIEKSAVKNFAANKEQSKSLIADIAPDVMDVVKLVSEKTGNKLEDVVNKTYDTIKDIAEGIGKRDIVDIIAGKYSDKKPLSELQKQINEIRNQAKLTIRLEEIKNNIERETKSRGEASPEVKALRKEISELQSQEGLRKRIEDVKNGVEKKVKEKGEQSEEVKALRKELSDLESQDRLKKRIEDLQNGVLRETKARGEASPEVQKLKKQADELNKKNKKELANFSANELKKQAEQLQKKIDKGEFLPQKTVKKVFEQDANWVKYSQEKKKLKQELNHLEAQTLYDKKNLYMKTLDQFNKFSRLGLFIFSTAYQLKLSAAALSTIAHKPIEDLVGTAIKPMVKEIADRAPIEGRNINAEATAEFYKNLSPIKILRGAYQILSKGESDLSRELSSHPKKEGNIFNPLSDHSVLNWIADDPHKIIKNPIKQGIFDASLANYMNYYASKGMDINDPILIEKARQASYMRAEYEIFMGGENSKTAVSEWFKKMESEGILDAQSESFKTKVGGNLKHSISALKNFIVPIASVPANILNRTVKNNPISTAYRFSEALKTNSELKNNVTETLDNLTEAQADLMLRDLKKGAIGSVYWTLGFIMAGNALGGFFNKSYPDKKRDKDEKGHDEMEIFGINIPHGVQHAVPLQQMQMAATFALTLKYFNEQDKKKLKDDFGLKDEIKNVGAGGAEIARTYINEHPMSKASLDIVKALEGGKGREKYFNSLERRSDIPQTKFLLQDIGLIEKDDSYEKQKAKSKKHKEVKDLYDVFWYMMDDKKFENHNE